jgi:PAS domain S-box-containing protein
MGGSYAYTPHIWPSVLTILLLLTLSAYSWQRRNVPGALMFMYSCLFAGLTTVGLAMMHLAVESETKIFWYRFEYTWLLPAATATTCFILEYAWPGRWLTRRNLTLLSIVPVTLALTIWTNFLFLLPPPTFIVGETVRGAFGLTGLLFTTYMMGLTFINLAAFAWLFLRSPQHRWLVAIMVVSQIVTRFLVIQEISQLGILVYNIPAFAIPYLAYAVALFGFHIFDPVPLARQTVIEQLRDGMLVLDQQGRVACLNSSAERILGVSMKQAKGRPVGELLPTYEEPIDVSDESETEISPGTGQAPRCYTLAVSLLKDFRGLAVGHLLLLHDVTEQKQAQAQTLEQQRVLAVQHERERLARELHDSLGQVLSYTSFQVESAARLFQNGQGDVAAAQLDRLGSVVREAHADLREDILNLHSTASFQQPFFDVVKQYLNAFTWNYNIQTILSAYPGLNEEDLPLETQLQVFRILQEALSNARKHGQAHQVQVVFAKEEGSLCMTIQDDGCGFDPEQIGRSGDGHYGLSFMHERAVQLAGQLQVSSAPDSGTWVVLEIPVNSKR